MPARPARRPSLPLLALAPVLALGLTACGGGADEAAPTDAPTSDVPSSTTSAAAPSSSAPTSSAPSPTAPARAAACDLITDGDVAKTTGLGVGAGVPATGRKADGALGWTSDDCVFTAPGTATVTIRVTGPGDFTKGTFSCPRPDDADGNVEPADDVANATQAWWRTNSAPPLEATLRACSSSANVDVDLAYEQGVNYDGDPRSDTARLAGFVLANLQG